MLGGIGRLSLFHVILLYVPLAGIGWAQTSDFFARARGRFPYISLGIHRGDPLGDPRESGSSPPDARRFPGRFTGGFPALTPNSRESCRGRKIRMEVLANLANLALPGILA